MGRTKLGWGAGRLLPGGSVLGLAPPQAPDTLCLGLGPHCTLAIPGPLWDAETFLVGAPSGDLQGPLSPLAEQEALSAPQELVEVGRPQSRPGHSLETEPSLAAVSKTKLFPLGLTNVLCAQ